MAAKRLNRKFIGIDNDKNYVELTRKKLEDKDIVIDKNKLKNETPGLYIDYELELIKKES